MDKHPNTSTPVSDGKYVDLTLPPASKRTVSREPSINTFTSFLPLVLDLPAIITEKEFAHATHAYVDMLDSAHALLVALDAVSTAYADFGNALDATVRECPKLHHLAQYSEGIANASGLEYLIGIVLQLAGRVLRESFEQPLRESLDSLQRNYVDHRTDYQAQVKERSRVLRQTELENLKLLRLRTRNIPTYKSNLVSLTHQLDELDRLKYEYYREVNSMLERYNGDEVLVRCGSVVRAQLELHESIAKKGWTGGGLEGLLNVAPDLFEVPPAGGSDDDDDDTSILGRRGGNKENADFSRVYSGTSEQGTNRYNDNKLGSQLNSNANANANSNANEQIDPNDDSDEGDADISVRTITAAVDGESAGATATSRSTSTYGASAGINDTSTPMTGRSHTAATSGDIDNDNDDINTSMGDESFSLPIINQSNPLLRTKALEE